MSNLSDIGPWLASGAMMRRAEVAGLPDDGGLDVRCDGADTTVRCQVLNPDGPGAAYATGDAVLVWLDEGGQAGVVLGHVGLQAPAGKPVVDAAAFAARPQSLLLEAQGDIVLRNGQARLRLGAQGDVEIACSSFTTRSRLLMRLLAPLIKLN